MFDISWTELLVVAVIAIIVVGPKELPGMLRAFGRTFGQVRRAAREFQTQFNDVLREAERQAGAEDLKKSVDQVRDLDPRRQVKKAVTGAQSDLDASLAAGEKRTETAGSPSGGEGAVGPASDAEAPAAATANGSAPAGPSAEAPAGDGRSAADAGEDGRTDAPVAAEERRSA